MLSDEQECHEEVSRRGEVQPCNKLAVAMRFDPTFGDPYPVCAAHARGANMMSLSAVEAAVRADMQREVRTVEELDALPLKTALLCTGSLSGEGDEDGVYLIEPAYSKTHPRRFACHGTTWFDPQDFLDCWESITVLFTPSTLNQQGAEQ